MPEDIIWISRMGLSIINMLLLIILICIFIRRYIDIPSKFNLGFLLVMVALFFRTFFSSPVIRFFVFGLETHSLIDSYRLIADIFETFALALFLFMSTK